MGPSFIKCSIVELLWYSLAFQSVEVLSFAPSRLPAGSWLLHHELLHVHLLGSVLRLPGSLPGQGVCSVRLRFRDSGGESVMLSGRCEGRERWSNESTRSQIQCDVLFF